MRIAMIPFGLLSGFMDSKEIRITELGEDGFRFRLAEECPEPEQFLICFYDMKKAGYRRVEIRRFGMSAAEEQCLQDQQPVEKKTEKYFYREYSVRVEQKDYVQEVRRLAGEYNRYIRLKLEGDDGELAKSLTGYPAELDEMHCRSLEEQKKQWFFREGEKASGNPQDTMGTEELRLLDNTEFALELNCTSLYEEYLRQPLQAFLAFYWQKNYLTHSYFAGRTPDRFYIGNQFCHNLFPTEEQLFFIMDKMYSEGSEITLVFSYIREFMLSSVGKLLEKVDNWCCIHGVNVEIVVNDWAMVEMFCGKTFRLHPVLGTLLNKRKKDPRMKYKSCDTLLFQQNSLNAGFYRDFLAEEFHIHRYEWESCGYPQELPPGKNSLHLPFYQTNTSQYCPLYALCTTGDRGIQQLAEHCPKFCEKYALLYPEHLHMAGRYNSLFGVDKTLPESTEMWKNIKGTKPDRIVVNI